MNIYLSKAFTVSSRYISANLALREIASLCDKNGQTTISQANLSKRIGSTQQTLRQALKYLQDKGHITVHKTVGTTPNTYEVNL